MSSDIEIESGHITPNSGTGATGAANNGANDGIDLTADPNANENVFSLSSTLGEPVNGLIGVNGEVNLSVRPSFSQVAAAGGVSVGGVPINHPERLIQQNELQGHGLVLRAVKGAKPLEYLKQIEARGVQPREITDCGFMGAGKFAVFFATKAALDRATEVGALLVKGQSVQLNPYVPALKKLVLLNCPPMISDEVIRGALLEVLRLEVVGGIEKIKYGKQFPTEYRHLNTLKRQVQVKKTEAEIPESFDLNFNGINFRIFIEHGPRRCHHCQSSKHVIAKCPRKNDPGTGMSTPGGDQSGRTPAAQGGPSGARGNQSSRTPAADGGASGTRRSGKKRDREGATPEDASQPRVTVQPSAVARNETEEQREARQTKNRTGRRVATLSAVLAKARREASSAPSEASDEAVSKAESALAAAVEARDAARATYIELNPEFAAKVANHVAKSGNEEGMEPESPYFDGIPKCPAELSEHTNVVKRRLGERIIIYIEENYNMSEGLSSAITGMLLECTNPQLEAALKDEAQLDKLINEALNVWLAKQPGMQALEVTPAPKGGLRNESSAAGGSQSVAAEKASNSNQAAPKGPRKSKNNSGGSKSSSRSLSRSNSVGSDGEDPKSVKQKQADWDKILAFETWRSLAGLSGVVTTYELYVFLRHFRNERSYQKTYDKAATASNWSQEQYDSARVMTGYIRQNLIGNSELRDRLMTITKGWPTYETIRPQTSIPLSQND